MGIGKGELELKREPSDRTVARKLSFLLFFHLYNNSLLG